ncbi:3-hydroxymethyl-3-methylglutaryl-CoA lyase, cytoplasmic [Sphaceloma murrayae]|uniref:3-hydroxymethyl-3-methylglutaryl-CoA lyase, cytoplasmic n=1 Tax=Sphaceloma murrayae TaxID=2082308 RepID=A0A2K1QUW4_9PEZI|nr:3-hydroxymethyl-3-methylglutaryl-CoA lyase, cytoplasmic [Sphaceloma murrayae]
MSPPTSSDALQNVPPEIRCEIMDWLDDSDVVSLTFASKTYHDTYAAKHPKFMSAMLTKYLSPSAIHMGLLCHELSAGKLKTSRSKKISCMVSRALKLLQGRWDHKLSRKPDRVYYLSRAYVSHIRPLNLGYSKATEENAMLAKNMAENQELADRIAKVLASADQSGTSDDQDRSTAQPREAVPDAEESRIAETYFLLKACTNIREYGDSIGTTTEQGNSSRQHAMQLYMQLKTKQEPSTVHIRTYIEEGYDAWYAAVKKASMSSMRDSAEKKSDRVLRSTTRRASSRAKT